MLFLLTQFADSSSGPAAALGVNMQAFLIQLITFLIAFLVLRQWAFKPIMKALHDRRKVIEEGIVLGEKMRAQEAKLQADVAHELHNAREQGDKIIAAAELTAKQALQEAEETARTRAAAIVQEGKAQVKQAAQAERTRLERELIGLVSEVSEAVIGEKVDAKKDAALLARLLEERKAA